MDVLYLFLLASGLILAVRPKSFTVGTVYSKYKNLFLKRLKIFFLFKIFEKFQEPETKKKLSNP